MKRVVLIILAVMLTAAFAACTMVEYLPAELTSSDAPAIPQASPEAAPAVKADRPEVRIKDGVAQWRVGDGEWHDVASIEEMREQYPELFAPEPEVTPVPTPKPSKKPSEKKESASDSTDDYADYGGWSGGGGSGGGGSAPAGPSTGDGTDMVL